MRFLLLGVDRLDGPRRAAPHGTEILNNLPEGSRARALMLELIELPMTAMRNRASRTRDWTVSLSPSRTEVALSADTGEGATPYLHQMSRLSHPPRDRYQNLTFG